MRATYLAVLFVATTAAACNPFDIGKRVTEQVERQAQEHECDELAAHPNQHLVAMNMAYYDEGIINDYRQLSSVTVLNPARSCSVTRAEGRVEWYDALGQSFGSTVFSLNKSVSAGDLARFSTADGTLSSTTIRGAATRFHITFTSVDVVRVARS